MNRSRFSLILSLCLAAILSFGGALYAVADITVTPQAVKIKPVGRYVNWDGVTNVAQFKGADGCLWYAVDSDDVVTVFKTKNGAPVAGSVTLKKPHPLFGTVVCDDDGYFYLVTGEENDTDDTGVETVFVSKFDQNGTHIKTVGDNGSSSLAYYYGSSFYTKIPFSGGNCDAVVSGNVLTVHYARKMYSGHQSNSVFSVNTQDLSKVSVGAFYESHSFAQRVVPTKDGFVYVSEGDCYERAFRVYSVRMSGGAAIYSQENSIFDFWVEDGALDAYNMFVLNDNFAHMGGLAALSDGKIAFAAQSVQSLNADAVNESEEIFIQIFDPYQPLNDPSSYVTQGERTGLAGGNGRTNVTNYGVKWLTSYGNDAVVSNVQIAVTDRDEIVVLYELTRDSHYDGVWYMVLDEKGNVIRPATRFAAHARLNPCETPVFAEGAVCWVGNLYDGFTYNASKQLYIYRLTGMEEDCSVTNNHTWDAGVVEREPTCISTGKMAFKCLVCSAEKTEEIERKAHTVTKTEARPATCTEAGNVEYFTCSACGMIFADAEGKTELETTVAPAKGHTMTKTDAKENTCTENGNVEYYTCSVCGKIFADAEGKTELETTVVPARGHTLEKVEAKEATFTEEGSIVYYKCTGCGKLFADKNGAEELKPEDVVLAKLPYMLGDMTLNGEIASDDARLALRQAVSLESFAPDSAQFLAGDVNFDGDITSADARKILRAAVELEDPADWQKQ